MISHSNDKTSAINISSMISTGFAGRSVNDRDPFIPGRDVSYSAAKRYASFNSSTIDWVAMAGDDSSFGRGRPHRASQGERVYPTQRRKSREIPIRGTQREAMLQGQRGQMRVRHEIGMHTGKREEFI
jgi:hypothetical protein